MTAPPILSFRPESRSGVQVELEKIVGARLLIQANSGGGKSWALRYLCEQLHGRIQIILIDPEGEFASLRERFPFLLAGAEGDVPAAPKTAKLLARRLLELRTSAIIDIYDLKLDQRREFVRIFLDELNHAPKKLWHSALVIIDEAHVYCPERGSGEASSTDAVITLCTQGRKKGFAAVLATQRLSKLHKDAAAELRNKLIGLTGLDLDQKRAGDELGFEKEQRLALRDLEPGNFWAFGPAISKHPTLVRAGDVATTHPKPGEIAPPAPPPPAAVKKMLEQMQGLEREAEEEARTIDDLQRQLATAKTQIRKLERGAPAAAPVADERAIARAVAAAEKHLIEQHGLAMREARNVERQLREQLAAQTKRMERIGKLNAQMAELTGVQLPEIAPAALPEIQHEKMKSAAQPVAQRVARATTSAPRARAETAEGALPRGEHAVLTAACQYPDEGVTREQATILTGYKRSTRDAYIQRLREKGLVEVRGDRVFALEGAEDVLGDFEPLPTGEALQQCWLDRLPAGEAAVFQVLIEEHPEPVSRDVLTDRTDYKRSTRDAYIQRLKARQIIELRGSSVKAADFLFNGGA